MTIVVFWIIIHHSAWAIACFKCRCINGYRFKRRTWLTERLGCPVQFSCSLLMAAAHNTADLSGGRVGHDHSGLDACIREVRIVVEYFFHAFLHRRIHGGVDDIAAGVQRFCVFLSKFQGIQCFFNHMIDKRLVWHSAIGCFGCDTNIRKLNFCCLILLCFFLADEAAFCHLI